MSRSFIVENSAVAVDAAQVITGSYNCVGPSSGWTTVASPFQGEWWDPYPQFPAVLALFNRIGSGVQVRVTRCELDALVMGSSGNPSYSNHAVLIGITACAGGTALTAVKMDSEAADPPAGLEVLLYPTASPLDAANTIRQTNVIPSPRSYEPFNGIAMLLGRNGGFAGKGMAFGDMLGMRTPSQEVILRTGEGAAWYPIVAPGPPHRYWVEITLLIGSDSYCYQTEFDVQAGEAMTRLPLVVWNNSATTVEIARICLVSMGEDIPSYEVVPVDDVIGGSVVTPVAMDSRMGLPAGVEIRALATVVRGGTRAGGQTPHFRAPAPDTNAACAGQFSNPLYGRYGLMASPLVGYAVSGTRLGAMLRGKAMRIVDLNSTGAILLREGQGVALVPRKRAIWGGITRAQLTFTTEYPSRPVARAHVGM